MLERPEHRLTTREIRLICAENEHAVDQAIEVLLSTGAATLESTGRKLPSRTYAIAVPEHQYCLTGDGARRIQDALEASQHPSGVFASFLAGGWEPAKAAWQARRAHRVMRPRPRRGHEPEDELSMFDPSAGRRFGRLYRWLQYRATKPR